VAAGIFVASAAGSQMDHLPGLTGLTPVSQTQGELAQQSVADRQAAACLTATVEKASSAKMQLAEKKGILVWSRYSICLKTQNVTQESLLLEET